MTEERRIKAGGRRLTALILVLIILCAAPGAAAGNGYLVVESNPPGAEVVLNGRGVGRTPLFQYELAPGHYDLRVSKDGFASPQEELEITPDVVQRIRKDLVKTFGNLTILLDKPLPGAMVHLDGTRVPGELPVTLTALPTGKHLCVLVVDGERLEQSVEVRSRETTVVRFVSHSDGKDPARGGSADARSVPAVQPKSARDTRVMNDILGDLHTRYAEIFNENNYRFVDSETFKVNVFGSRWIEHKRAPKLKNVPESIQKAYDMGLYFISTGTAVPKGLSLLSMVDAYESNGKGGLENLGPIRKIIDVERKLDRVRGISGLNGDVVVLYEKNPDRAEENAMMAYEYASGGRMQDAEKAINKALATHTTNDDVYITIAEIYRVRNDRAKELEICERGLGHVPGSVDLRSMKERAENEQSKAQSAEQQALFEKNKQQTQYLSVDVIYNYNGSQGVDAVATIEVPAKSDQRRKSRLEVRYQAEKAQLDKALTVWGTDRWSWAFTITVLVDGALVDKKSFSYRKIEYGSMVDLIQLENLPIAESTWRLRISKAFQKGSHDAKLFTHLERIEG